MQEQKIVRIFVASPNDVKPEREILEEIVKELNDTWSALLGIYLHLIKWETHTYPSFGSDPQAIINEQLGDDYEIFIGILWTHFGTSTPRAESGTVEEFKRAYDRYKADPDSIRVMFYFKDQPIPPSKIDPDQLACVKKFRDSLGKLGGLYWTFENLEGFTKYLRMHLSRQFQYWKDRPIVTNKRKIETVSVPKPQSQDIEAFEDTEEDGFLDLVEVGTENFELLAEVANKLTDLMNQLAENTEENTKEIQSLDVGAGKNEVKRAKRLVNRMAQQLEQFSDRMDAEIPLYRKYFSTAIDAYGKAATLLTDFDTDSTNQIENSLVTVKSIEESVRETRKALASFRQIIASLPRVTTRFNRSKRHCVSVLDDFAKEMEAGINLTGEVEKLMKGLLE